MAEPANAPRRSPRKGRCAIYTRKSSEEGLEQAFNSLDAQREACAAFVLSQKHEGWTLSTAKYDDGGFSGGTMERPALKRLIADIEAGRIDVIVVYKVDRLTRALSDFAKLVDVFDRRQVSFVSITQQFNTTTSMGRLTLNVLLSFAQFEREVIGERVRDKVAASKKKGMWMGGMPPLGYDVKDRKLVVNDDEARTVVEIFQRYLALGSVRSLNEELRSAGIRSKRRVRPNGGTHGNQPFGRGALYAMLQNRIYRGEITHKGNAYAGKHPAIIEEPLWDSVQALLAKNRVERVSGARARHSSVLGGLIFDAAGERLTPTYAIKKGAHYRYYVSSALVREATDKSSSGWRIPAADLERVVIERLRAYLIEPAAILDAVGGDGVDGSEQRHLIAGGHRLARELGSAASDKVKTIVMGLLSRVSINIDRVEIALSRRGLNANLAEPSRDGMADQPKPDADDLVTLNVPTRLKRVGREMRVLVDNGQTAPDPSLLRLVARAHDIQGRLSRDTDLTVHDIARDEGVSPAYVYILLRLPWLAPDITTAVVEGRQPEHLNATTLMQNALRLPADWTEQRRLLGFS